MSRLLQPIRSVKLTSANVKIARIVAYEDVTLKEVENIFFMESGECLEVGWETECHIAFMMRLNHGKRLPYLSPQLS